MTKQEYLEFHKNFCGKMIEVTQHKNHDYTSDSADPFANFRVVENIGITSTEIGFLTRMTDKISRISTFVKKGELHVKDESVKDTLLDLANYAVLLAGYLESKKSKVYKAYSEMVEDAVSGDPY